MLTLSWRRSLSYRNQSTDLQSNSLDRFLYDSDLRHKRGNQFLILPSVRNCRVVFSLCKQDFMSCRIIFLDWHNNTNLVPFLKFSRKKKIFLQGATVSKIKISLSRNETSSLNCFVCVAPYKKRCRNQVGQFKSDQKYFAI